MINQQELNISNKSYVNKDFQKLYPEILELARQLSAKWDPSTSNESDPGVVLLKLLGFMGDKINYNIDKNILESFMPSATQESSMRNLAEINGYYPRYYISATTDISFMYTGNKLGANQSFKLPAFSTTVTDVNNEITYTLLEDCIINERFITKTVPAIEGVLESLTINDVTEIHIANLDDNNRIYFSERFVAENGVFVQRVNDVNVFWVKVNNLNTNEPGQLVYKFGFDSVRNAPYLEFPNDISSIIGDGLTIQYIRTTGSSGNVRAGFLTKLSSPSEIIDTSNIVVYPDTNENQTETTVLTISNLSDSSNGEDPESIDDIYNSFKRTVGTFDTLVTSRDYANAIYNLLTSDSKNVVSNVQVADRRTDINYSNQITSFNQYGPVKLNVTNNEDITPFDLCLYPLAPIITSYNLTTYTNSFLPLYDLIDIQTGIENFKTISHNYKSLLDEDVYLYKNYYKLNAKISTNFKVNTFEQNSILSNINDALFRNFNSRELDYGQEIPFDTLLNTIQNADTRIKNVSLEEPEIFTKVMTRSKAETFLLDPSNKTPYLNLLTKNILAGRASLFEYNTDFDFEYGQSSILLSTEESSAESPDFLHENLIKITTEVTIPEASVKSPTGYTLKENEYIQAIAPSLSTEVIYPAYINYKWNGVDVPENKEHTITGEEYLLINYVDSNNTNIAIKYTVDKVITYRVSKEREAGQDYYTSTIVNEVTVPYNIFKPVGLTLKETAEYSISGIVITKIIQFGANLLDFYTLGTEESIEKRKFVETTLTSSSLPCYWIVNTQENALFTEENEILDGSSNVIGYERLLGENEYFMYSNSSLTELEVLGSGTRLTLKATGTEDLDSWKIIFSDTEEKVEITTVSENGLAAFENYNWKYKNFNNLPNSDPLAYNLKIEEMSILTLGTGDNIQIADGSSSFSDFTNDWVDVGNDWTISYTIDGETKSLPKYTTTPWQVRSRLDLNSGPDLKQKILTNQTMTLVLSDGGTGEKTRIFNKNNANVNGYISFNTLLQRAGGKDIDLKVTYLNGTTSYDVDAYTFTYIIPTYTELDGRIVNVEKQPSGYYQINLKNLEVDSSDVATVDLPIVSYYDDEVRLSGDGKSQLVMIYWEHSIGTATSITLNGTGAGGLRKYNSGSSYASTLVLTPGINVIEMKALTELTLEVSDPASGNDVLQLTGISITSGYNSTLNLDVADFEGSGGILEKIDTLDPNGLFFYNGSLDSYSLIEFDDVSDPRALFDYNNLANRFTLAQIDFEGSKIEIVRTSRI